MSAEEGPQVGVDPRDLPPGAHLKALVALGAGLALAYFVAVKVFL